jgi:Flp pilus assembly protein TadG
MTRLRQSAELLLQRFRRFRRDRRGVGAVEFALIAPLLLSLYITSFELTIGLSMSKRVTRTASTIADLVTQQSSVKPAYLTTMVDVAESIFTPYAPENLKVNITGISVDGSGNPKVAWSWSENGGKPYGTGTVVNAVPDDMRTANTFLVRAEVSVTHQILMFMPAIMPSEIKTLTLRREFFYRQRVGSNLICEGC